MTYAANTSVSVDKSRAEIESTLRRYGSTTFHSGWDEAKAFVAFTIGGRLARLSMPLPAKDDKRFVRDGRGSRRSPASQQMAYEQELRTRFRALLLCIKAKLESVEAKIETFDQAFLAHIVLPDNSLVGERVQVLVEDAYRSGRSDAFLPAPGESEVSDG